MLIICSECGKEFSDKAISCPNCGCPTREIVNSWHDNEKENTEDEKGFEFHYTDPNNVTVEIKNNYVVIYKKGKVKKEGSLSYFSWCEYKQPGAIMYGSITLHQPNDFFGTVLCFTKEYTYQIEKLKSNMEYKPSMTEEKEKAKKEDIYVNQEIKKQEKKYFSSFHCPKCKSTNISIANTKTKTTINLNPLKPLTLVNHKATKESWICHDCGKRWEKKVK